MARWSCQEEWSEGFRRCTKCNEIKKFLDFHKHKGCKGGYNSVCKLCRLPLSKSGYKNTSLELKIWGRAKRRAGLASLPFNIEVSDILIPDVCPVFLVPFIVGDTNWAASVDRLIPELGYTKGNIYIISNRANRLKNDFTLEEFDMIKKYMEERIV